MPDKMKPTHMLKCSHVIGGNRKEYRMSCIVLKEMPRGRLKIKVFGERNWKGKAHISRIRYVPAERVVPLLPVTEKTHVRNHEPDQQGKWFAYTGWRYKDHYAVRLRDGQVIRHCYPNGNGWHAQYYVGKGGEQRFDDEDVIAVRLMLDEELHPRYHTTGPERVVPLLPVTEKTHVRNHEPDQQGKWFAYTGWRYKDLYDIRLRDGTEVLKCYPNGNGWYANVSSLAPAHGGRCEDEDVIAIRLVPDSELDPQWHGTGQGRIDHQLRLFGHPKEKVDA